MAAIGEAREDWTGAHARLIAWLELEPKNGLARHRLGRVFFGLGKAKEAFDSLTQAVKDMPGLEPPGVSMGKLYSSKGDAKKAAEWFEYALKAEPGNPQVHLAHAGWLMDQGQPAPARKESTKP